MIIRRQSKILVTYGSKLFPQNCTLVSSISTDQNLCQFEVFLYVGFPCNGDVLDEVSAV
jgi:hypothetical protein